MITAPRTVACLLLASLLAAACRRKEPSAAEVCARAFDRAGEEEAERYRRMTRGGAVPPQGNAIKGLSAECAPVFRAERCRLAHQHYLETPVHDRVHVLVDACRESYCPGLPEPRPALCTRDGATFSETSALWQELRRAILQHDLGPEAKVVLDAMDRSARRVTEAEAGYFDAGSPAYYTEGEDGPPRASVRMIPKTAGSAQQSP